MFWLQFFFFGNTQNPSHSQHNDHCGLNFHCFETKSIMWPFKFNHHISVYFHFILCAFTYYFKNSYLYVNDQTEQKITANDFKKEMWKKNVK